MDVDFQAFRLAAPYYRLRKTWLNYTNLFYSLQIFGILFASQGFWFFFFFLFCVSGFHVELTKDSNSFNFSCMIDEREIFHQIK